MVPPPERWTIYGSLVLHETPRKGRNIVTIQLINCLPALDKSRFTFGLLAAMWDSRAALESEDEQHNDLMRGRALIHIWKIQDRTSRMA